VIGGGGGGRGVQSHVDEKAARRQQFFHVKLNLSSYNQSQMVINNRSLFAEV
jgi:hypothetical protein